MWGGGLTLFLIGLRHYVKSMGRVWFDFPSAGGGGGGGWGGGRCVCVSACRDGMYEWGVCVCVGGGVLQTIT